MSKEIEVIFLQQRIDEMTRHLVYAGTAIRNALAELENDEIEEAIKTLQQIVGKNESE